jgi:hypothetical protein
MCGSDHTCLSQTTLTSGPDHIYVWARPHLCLGQTTFMSGSDHIYVWARPHLCLGQTTLMSGPDHIYVWVRPHLCLGQTTLMSGPDHTYVWVRPHLCLGQIHTLRSANTPKVSLIDGKWQTLFGLSRYIDVTELGLWANLYIAVGPTLNFEVPTIHRDSSSIKFRVRVLQQARRINSVVSQRAQSIPVTGEKAFEDNP